MEALAVQRSVTPSVREKADRLISLDLLRGLAVAGMILVNEMAGMQSKGPVYTTLLHSRWDGLTLADLVFPAFLMMMGVSVPLSFAAGRKAGGFGRDQARRIALRTLRLIAAGFILSNLWWLSRFSATPWRLFGVLQRIGLVYGACAVLFLLCAPRTRVIIIAMLLVLYWPLALLPPLDGLPGNIWMRGHNFVGSVDRMLLGAHNYVKGPEGYDPEGLLGTLPAIAHGLIGVAVGEYLLRGDQLRERRLAAAGLAMLAVGGSWSLAFPVVKDIWSSTFVLVTCGLTSLLLAALLATFDEGQPLVGWRKAVSIVLLPFGMNAIAAYVLHELAGSMLGWDLLLVPYRQACSVVPPQVAAFVPVLLFIAFIWACMDYLRRKGWIIKI